MWLPLTHPQLGSWPTTQACALSGNQTSDLLVCRLALNPLSHTSQGCTLVLIQQSYTTKVGNFLKEKLKLVLLTFQTCIIVDVLWGKASYRKTVGYYAGQNKYIHRKISISTQKSPDSYHWIITSQLTGNDYVSVP